MNLSRKWLSEFVTVEANDKDFAEAMTLSGSKVEVTVDTSQTPVPNAVRVSGQISPYGKKQLQQMIANDLGIALEAQIWTE